MDIVLDTCLFIRNDGGQSKVPYFRYDYLDELLQEPDNHVFISGFSLPEIFILRDYKTVTELKNAIFANNTGILSYNFSNLHADFSVYDEINAYAACAFYHLTTFLEFLVCQVLLPLNLDDIEPLNKEIHKSTDQFYDELGEITLSSFTRFMKQDSVKYIIDCINTVLLHYGKRLEEREIWALIARTKINSGVPFHEIDINFIRYAKYLTNVFRQKVKNKAKTIKMTFGIIDLLIAHASNDGYVVISSDKDLCLYLLTYGNKNNKDVIRKIWVNI